MKPKLVIVERKPTQFDAPLYSYLSHRSAFSVTVFYTQTYTDTIDPEIERIPQWDHLHSCHYARKDLGPAEATNARIIANEIAALRPDLVILGGYYPLLYAKIAWFIKRKGIRIGLRSDNTLLHSAFKGIKGAIKHLFLPFWLRQYDTWHPVGTLARQYLEEIANTKKPTYFFPYNVDNDWFLEESSRYRYERNVILTGMGFSPHDSIVLGVMKWHDREDPLTLLDAFATLKERHQNARLVLVGDGPLRNAVHAKVKNLHNSVFLPGYVPYSHLPKYFAVSDVFVHPAIDECWGVSVNEAMACGVPVITADGVGAAADLIAEGKTGAVYTNRDSGMLSRKLSELLNDKEHLAVMSANAKQMISEWSYKQTLRELLMALESEPRLPST